MDGRKFTPTISSGRLDKITDAKGQVKTHSYFNDSQLKEIAYSNSQIPTANVSFTYDPIYGRLATMNDGTGSTSYSYHPVGQLGALMPASIDGPLANDIIALTYDAQSRLKTHSIDGTANTTSMNAYDNLGRITQLTNPLGTFQHSYDPVNLLPKTITAPNGMVTEFSYQPASADLRLQEIKHTLSGNVPLSKHNYEYRKNGNINSWQQQIGTAPARKFSFGYDKGDQLTSATLTAVANPNAPLESHSFQYDKAGNRTSRQNGNVVESTTHNNTNALTSTQAGGKMRVAGVTDETAKVTVNGKPAFTNAQKQYEAWVDVAAGENTLTIEAEDFSLAKNKRTKSWKVNVTGAAKTPAYDLNGNTLTDGTGKGYAWDAENRLVKIIYADNSSTEFEYNGISQRVRVIEKSAANDTLTDKRYLWAGGNQPAEERDATGTTVLKRYFPQGEQIPAAAAPLNKLFYSKDHLGNIRELTDSNGTLQARYDYDMWGKRVKLSGTLDTEVGYTGHHHHAKSGLVLTWYRAYDAEQGRWLSVDPLGEAGGINLYGYVNGDPVNGFDPLGLACISISTNKGKKYKATNPSNADVRKFLRSLAPNEKIRNLEINGHGFSQGININDQTGDGLEMGYNILSSGAIMQPAQWSDTLLPIAPDFAGHTDSNTNVYLDGCNTANTRKWLWGTTDNLGKAVSESLKDATVTGLRGPGWVSNPVTGNANHVSGLPRRYKNGKIK